MREAVEIYKTGNGRAAEEKINDAYENVNALQNARGVGGGCASFLPVFLIFIRKGLEAVLVLVAIIAYLFSSMIESTTAGAGREILEGATALFAVVVLIGTSAWLGGKADAKVWKEYIQGMVDKSMMSGQ